MRIEQPVELGTFGTTQVWLLTESLHLRSEGFAVTYDLVEQCSDVFSHFGSLSGKCTGIGRARCAQDTLNPHFRSTPRHSPCGGGILSPPAFGGRRVGHD